MTVRVLYFASLADRAGVRDVTIEIPDAADVAGLWELVRARHPRLAQVTHRPAAACDLEYAEWTRSLSGVSEVAFLPPVSGG